MPQVYRLNEYQVPAFLIKHVALDIDLRKLPVRVVAKLTVFANPASESISDALTLDGQNMELQSVKLDGTLLAEHDYQLTDHSLCINKVPRDREFIIESTTLLGQNSDLFGLYETEGTVLIKAETLGMQRVFYCLDRPDVLATYHVTVSADAARYPVLLSNGDLLSTTPLPDGAHQVIWYDKVPKPTYLFALVGGQLQLSEATYSTQAGRPISIAFYVPPAATSKCNFAKEVIKSAIQWDEMYYNLPCDLTQHRVAGVDKYASGASEPTGMNLFNTANLYAIPQTTTDAGFLRVLEVVAHEYFHYWTGNRVTIRDWFNLTFKEGLTTFRAALFRDKLFGGDLVRILDGKNLDARAPRQSSYEAVRSLYTAAAYEKGADIFRMMMVMVGEEVFAKALSEFLQDHDGAAVTLEELLISLSSNTGVDCNRFLPWFTETGIPLLKVTDEFDTESQTYTLKVNTVDAKSRPIPLVIGLLNSAGQDLLGDQVLVLDKAEMEFHFTKIPTRPIPSLLRSFSAPVHTEYHYSNEALIILMQHDVNQYNRFDATNHLIVKLVQEHCNEEVRELPQGLVGAYQSILADPSLSHWMRAELLRLPAEEELIAGIDKPQFEKIAQARSWILHSIGVALQEELWSLYDSLQLEDNTSTPQFTDFDIRDAGRRRLILECLSYLQSVAPEKTKAILLVLFNASLGQNMTLNLGALTRLCEINCPESHSALDRFYTLWEQDPTAVNYWFNLQGAAHSPEVITNVKQLLQHPAFDLTNPNNVYALLGAFIKNPYGFHGVTGKGYAVIANVISKLDIVNPALAGKLTESYINWDKYDETRQQAMLKQLRHINEQAVSVDVKSMAKLGLDKVKPRSNPQKNQVNIDIEDNAPGSSS